MFYNLSSKNIFYSFSKENKVALTVESGDSVCLETLDCFSNQIQLPSDKLDFIDWNRLNPATGPIFIKDAMPNDTLEITIKEITISNKGVIATGKDLGLLGDLMEELYFKLVAIRDDRVVFDEKTSLSLKPMIGVIGVAPEDGQINCGTPGSHGGNMDTKLITEGAKLYLPVFVEGALFGLGDLHALMGDGEIGVSGVEVAGKVVVELRVLKNYTISNPIIKTDNVVATIASHETLDGAASNAVHDMANIFKKFTNMEIKDISMLFSIVGNLEISQVVDPLKTARFSMPNIVLENYGICF